MSLSSPKVPWNVDERPIGFRENRGDASRLSSGRVESVSAAGAGATDFMVFRPHLPWRRLAAGAVVGRLGSTLQGLRQGAAGIWGPGDGLPTLLAQGAAKGFEAIVRLVLTCLCFTLGFRFVRIPTFAFGHLAIEPDLLIKERMLGRMRRRRPIWIIDKQAVANRALLDLWRKRTASLCLPRLDLDAGWFRRIRKSDRIFFDTGRYIGAINETAAFGEIQRQWGGRRPVLELPSGLRSHGYEVLGSLGFPRDGWFACVHCREAGYHERVPGHNFRNADIRTYRRAIDFIRSQGGWIVRLGDPTMQPLPEQAGVFDYAHSSVRDDWMDVFFAAECDYILGSCSGPSGLPAAFGKAMAMPNCLPMSATPSYCHNGLGVGTPKLLYSEQERRLLTFAEVMGSEIGNYRWFEQYQQARLTIIDNDDEDILEVAREIHAMARGKFRLEPGDGILQGRVRGLFRPGHYGYLSECLFSPAFLRKHEALLPRSP